MISPSGQGISCFLSARKESKVGNVTFISCPVVLKLPFANLRIAFDRKCSLCLPLLNPGAQGSEKGMRHFLHKNLLTVITRTTSLPSETSCLLCLFLLS